MTDDVINDIERLSASTKFLNKILANHSKAEQESERHNGNKYNKPLLYIVDEHKRATDIGEFMVTFGTPCTKSVYSLDNCFDLNSEELNRRIVSTIVAFVPECKELNLIELHKLIDKEK